MMGYVGDGTRFMLFPTAEPMLYTPSRLGSLYFLCYFDVFRSNSSLQDAKGTVSLDSLDARAIVTGRWPKPPLIPSCIYPYLFFNIIFAIVVRVVHTEILSPCLANSGDRPLDVSYRQMLILCHIARLPISQKKTTFASLRLNY
jgi:hypothetical protein